MVGIEHPHITQFKDMAVHVKKIRCGDFTTVTAWKYKCSICGREFVTLTKTGIELLQNGYEYSDVVEFFEDRKK